MARYSLFVLKVPLNPKQTNKQFGAAFKSVFTGDQCVNWLNWSSN